MFKLKNSDAIKFNSPIIYGLLNDNNRRFPVKDALLISNIIAQIIENIKPFKEAYRKIIIDNGGVIAEGTEQVSYPNNEQAYEADKQLKEIASIELEYHGEPLEPKEGWPSLTIPEANILNLICNE